MAMPKTVIGSQRGKMRVKPPQGWLLYCGHQPRSAQPPSMRSTLVTGESELLLGVGSIASQATWNSQRMIPCLDPMENDHQFISTKQAPRASQTNSRVQYAVRRASFMSLMPW